MSNTNIQFTGPSLKLPVSPQSDFFVIMILDSLINSRIAVTFLCTDFTCEYLALDTVIGQIKSCVLFYRKSLIILIYIKKICTEEIVFESK